MKLEPETQTGSGLKALASDDFSVWQAIGGWRGLVESVLPGLVFLVLLIVSGQLTLTVLVSGALALLQVAVRLLQRQSWLGALTGVCAVAICLLWAWLSRDARNYYLPGFITNAVWILALAVSLACKIPGIGLLVEYVRQPAVSGFRSWLDGWRQDRALYRAYWWVSLLWIGLFAIRLGIQLPLYLSHQVAWLGTSRLVMGLPLFAVVIWVSWLLLAGPFHAHHSAQAQS